MEIAGSIIVFIIFFVGCYTILDKACHWLGWDKKIEGVSESFGDWLYRKIAGGKRS